MHYRAIIRILGLLIALFSVTMIPPAIVSLIYQDGSGLPFTLAFILCVIGGMALWYPNRLEKSDLRAREGFLIVALFWSVLASVGAIPLILLEQPSMTVTDAFFESFSGLTTTGATVIEGIDFLPHSVQFYRQQLQWLGGMGIIVLAVAILPILGVGGMQLYRAETPGPVKDNKMTPRIADTAKHLWYIYLSITIAVTNDDEANIMSAMLAKRMGAQKAMVLIQRSAYVDLVQGGEIDIAFSPQQATISALLTHVRRGDIVNVYSLRRGAAEAIEAIAHGDENTSKVVGRQIGDIKLPPGTTIGAIVRDEQVIIAHSDTKIEANDHVILFLVDKKYINDVEKLFQPSAFFFG